jgi:CBS domain containing-hemolysin-like protein
MSPPGWLIVAAIVLTLIAGWWANAEAALARMRGRGADGAATASQRASRRLEAVLADLPRYLNALLLLRVGFETFATVLVTVAFVEWFGVTWHAFAIAAAVMIIVRYVIRGVSPRTLGRRRSERVALAAVSVLYPFAVALGPVPRMLIAVGNLFTPGRGARERSPDERAELRGLVDFLEQQDEIEPGEREMVRSVFELGDTIVREVMVPRTDMVFIERDKTIGQALSLALRSGFSRIPVVGENEDDVVGIAYLKDIVAWSHERPGSESSDKVGQVMRRATFVPDSKPINELLRQMQALRIHVAIVIDEYGGTAGLVTIEDILEEIVGEITDEYDKEQPPVEWLSPDAARVTARLPVADLAGTFGVSIEAEDVETTGGLLAHALGRVPIAGSVVTVNGLRLTAENLSGRRNRIGTVLVERVKPAGQQAGGEGQQARGEGQQARGGDEPGR